MNCSTICDVRRPSPCEVVAGSASGHIVPYPPPTPMRVNDRTRTPRVSQRLLGRPVPSRLRHEVLDDALLGSAWRWDADDDRGAPAC